MKISARNVIKGKIVGIASGAVTDHVKLDIGGAVITAAITAEAVKDLKLKEGMEAFAVIKASDVMIGVDR